MTYCRAAQGHHPADDFRQGSRDRQQDHPRHQGTGSLLRRNSADDRERHVHHQRHRARHRQPVAPLARRVLRDAPTTAPTSSARSFRTADRGWNSNTTRRTSCTSASTASASSSARSSCAPWACGPTKRFCAPSTPSTGWSIRDKKLFWTLDPASEKPTNLLGMKLSHSIKSKSGEEIAHSGRKINAATLKEIQKAKISEIEVDVSRSRRRLGGDRRGRHHHRRSAARSQLRTDRRQGCRRFSSPAWSRSTCSSPSATTSAR